MAGGSLNRGRGTGLLLESREKKKKKEERKKEERKEKEKKRRKKNSSVRLCYWACSVRRALPRAGSARRVL